MRDKDIRAAVRVKLAGLHQHDPSTCIVEEMGVWAGTVRIDIAVINGEMAGYELKSDRDTLTRLPNQAEYYSRVFNKLTLVVAPRHLQKSISIIPDWWGIICAEDFEGEVKLSPVRDNKINPAPDAYLIAELLRKDEAIKILDEFQLAKGWRSKRVKAIHQRLANELPIDLLSMKVRNSLKSRKDWLGQN